MNESRKKELLSTIHDELMEEWEIIKIWQVNLSGNNLGPKGAAALAPALRVAASLTACNMEYNDLDEPSEQLLRDSVKDRPGFQLEL